MAHVSKESTFETVHHFSFVTCQDQFFLRLLQFGNIIVDTDDFHFVFFRIVCRNDYIHTYPVPFILLAGTADSHFSLKVLPVSFSDLPIEIKNTFTVFGMQFLDFFDFLTNSVMMPIAAITICLLVSRVIGVEKIEEEVTLCGKPFRRKRIFNFMIKYLCPIFAAIILISSVANALGVISM